MTVNESADLNIAGSCLRCELIVLEGCCFLVVQNIFTSNKCCGSLIIKTNNSNKQKTRNYTIIIHLTLKNNKSIIQFTELFCMLVKDML